MLGARHERSEALLKQAREQFQIHAACFVYVCERKYIYTPLRKRFKKEHPFMLKKDIYVYIYMYIYVYMITTSYESGPTMHLGACLWYLPAVHLAQPMGFNTTRSTQASLFNIPERFSPGHKQLVDCNDKGIFLPTEYRHHVFSH